MIDREIEIEVERRKGLRKYKTAFEREVGKE